MCTPLNEYRDYLTKLVSEKSPSLFSNGGKEYASILMSILLENTTKSVCMFCEGFKPDLITSKEYWDALKKYLRETDKTLHILVNSDSYINDRPLQAVFKEQKRRSYNGTIQVRLIDDNGREEIKGQFNGALNNFSVFDDYMYRLEYEPSEYKAFGSFYNPEDAKLLLDLFNRVFEKSQPLNDGAAA